MNIITVSYIYPKKSNARTGIFVHQRAKYMVKAGHHVDVITTSGPGDRKHEIIDGVNVHRVSGIYGPLFAFKAMLKISQLSKSKKIDFVMQEFVGLSTILLGVFIEIFGIRFVLVSHGSKWEIQAGLRKFFVRLALFFPEKIFCVSRNIKERLAVLTDKRKVFVLNNGMDPDLKPSKSAKQFRKELGIKNEKVLLTVSNLVSKKGIDVLIKAFANVVKECNALYIIVGEGPEKEKLQSLIQELNLGDKVRLYDKKVGKELANYYNACDVFAVMSRDIDNEVESFGIVYLEAAYFAKPVIGGISGGTADAVEDGKTGYLINANNQKKIEDTLILLLKNKKLRHKLGKAGKERVLKGFLWEHSVERLIGILRD